MGISKEWYDRLHILIPYYRRVLKLSQNDVYRRHSNNKWIISPATVKKLENHEQVFIKDEKYQDLLFNLNKQLHISQEIDHYLIIQSKQLYCVMETEKYEEAIQIIGSTLLSLKSQRHHVYYKECIFFLGKLFLYLKDCVFMNEQEYSLLFPLVNIFPKGFKDILLDFLYVHASGGSEKMIFDFFNTYSLSTSDYLPNRINYANQLYEEGKGLRAEHILQDIKPIAKEKGSKMQLAYIYIILSSIALHSDIELCYSYLYTLEKMYVEEQKDNNLKGMILLNLANRYLMLRDYEQCSSYTKAYMVLNPNRHYTSNIILLSHCNQMLNKKIDKALFINDNLTLEYDDQLENLLFSYYKQTFKNNKERIKYLLNKVSPFLTIFDKIYARIVNDEIAKLSTESGSYINYFRFQILQQNENNQR